VRHEAEQYPLPLGDESTKTIAVGDGAVDVTWPNSEPKATASPAWNPLAEPPRPGSSPSKPSRVQVRCGRGGKPRSLSAPRFWG